MKKIELLIEKTDPGNKSIGPIYYLYAIRIDGNNIGGGANYSISEMIVKLIRYIKKEIACLLFLRGRV